MLFTLWGYFKIYKHVFELFIDIVFKNWYNSTSQLHIIIIITINGGILMHVFQPYPIDVVECNPFTKIGKEWALITAGDKNKFNTMTVSWGGLGVLWGKNVVYIFIRESRYTKEFLDNGDLFSASFLSEDYREALNYCGANSGRDADKFEKASLTPAFRHNIPYPDEANFVILCKKLAAIPIDESTFTDPSIKKKWYSDGDMHTMYVGEIIDMMAR